MGPILVSVRNSLVRMNNTQIKPEKTLLRLLISASRVFAEKGFQESTVAEICVQAKANIASVNYYIGNKETLYIESWRFAFNQELNLYPLDDGLSANASAEQRLAKWIKPLIKRVADDNSYSFAILYREMAQPIRLLADILEMKINPQRSQLFALVKECLGQAASDEQLQY
jgi:TetR/AcrR family transcriptional regulator, regulator of cefoperazone and chloramphenicol sensitivity